jgi:hypothetical protein
LVTVYFPTTYLRSWWFAAEPGIPVHLRKVNGGYARKRQKIIGKKQREISVTEHCKKCGKGNLGKSGGLIKGISHSFGHLGRVIPPTVIPLYDIMSFLYV